MIVQVGPQRTAGDSEHHVVDLDADAQIVLVEGIGDLLGQLLGAVNTLLLLTSLTFLPALLLMMTSFTRIIIVLSLLRQALDAFARLDPEQAQKVILADNDVDTEFKSIVRRLITHMMEDPRTITTSIDIIWIARAIERIGDHAKNISEQVVFIVEGRDIRHTKEKAK